MGSELLSELAMSQKYKHWPVMVSKTDRDRFQNAKTWCLDCTLNFHITCKTVCCGWIWTDVLQMSLSLFCRYLERKESTYMLQIHPGNRPLHKPSSRTFLPLLLVENPNFRHFLSVMDCKYTPVSRTSLKYSFVNYLYFAFDLMHFLVHLHVGLCI